MATALGGRKFFRQIAAAPGRLDDQDVFVGAGVVIAEHLAEGVFRADLVGIARLGREGRVALADGAAQIAAAPLRHHTLTSARVLNGLVAGWRGLVSSEA